MKWIDYTKYNEEDLGIEVEDLLNALANLFLRSGFDDPYMQFSEMKHQSLEDLKQAIERALTSGDLFNPEHMEEMQQRLNQMTAQQKEQMVERLIQKLE